MKKLMVNFNDIIVKDGASPVIELTLLRKSYLNSLLKIYENDKVVYSGIINNLKEKVEFNVESGSNYNYRAQIERNNYTYIFPFYILKLKENEPYIICDIDFTVSATNVFLYVTKNLLNIKKIHNSSDVLKNLAKSYKIIYLTGRIKEYNKLTKMWLKQNDYPDGPIIARSSHNSNLVKFKTNSLRSISSISQNGIGIGDLNSDILAYKANGLIAIKITRPFLYYSRGKNNYILKNDYYLVSCWKGIENLFNEKKFFKGEQK